MTAQHCTCTTFPRERSCPMHGKTTTDIARVATEKRAWLTGNGVRCNGYQGDRRRA